MMENVETNNITWGKIAQILIPIVLTILVAVIGFLVTQVMSIRSDMELRLGELRVQNAKDFGKVQEQLGRQDVVIKNVASKIDMITITRFRGNDSE